MRSQRIVGVLVVVCALCVGSLFHTPAARAVGVWSHAAPLPATLAQHTATPLPDGRVLVTGEVAGTVPSAFLVTAYDPAADRWSTPAPMPRLQGWQAPALLRDGRVLFTGGGNLATTPGSFRHIDAAQIYDPAAGTWTPVAPMTTARSWHTATTLRDGTVLVVGGDVGDGYASKATASAERYDPTTNRWSPAGQLAAARYFHTATLLKDGRVLVAGGSANDARGLGGLATATAELYDPTTNRWSGAGSMATPHGEGHTATLLADGRVLVAGGDTTSAATPITATAELYDPATNRWASAGSMASPRGAHTATLLPSGRVLVAGGTPSHAISATTVLATAELYDPASNAWAGAAPMGGQRVDYTATPLTDGRVLLVGGSDGRGGGPLTTTELYTPTPGPEACFAETGKCIRGPFLAYWQQHGGLAVNGYPLSDESIQVLGDGKAYQVQYFERVRLEYHPENPAPWDIELGQFGRQILQERTGQGAAPPAQPKSGDAYFQVTGHNVAPDFFQYWQANGGLAPFGYPLTEEFQERLEDGKTYTVQYFERARFERHPENQPPWQIELGQFGRQILAEGGH